MFPMLKQIHAELDEYMRMERILTELRNTLRAPRDVGIVKHAESIMEELDTLRAQREA